MKEQGEEEKSREKRKRKEESLISTSSFLGCLVKEVKRIEGEERENKGEGRF